MDKAGTDDKKRLLGEAEAAARRGDALAMVRSLFASGVLDSLVWRVRQEFHGRLADEEVRDCVAEAVADCYASLVKGNRVTTLVGYLLKSARNMAVDLLAEFRERSTADPEQVADDHDPEADAARDAARAALQAEALKRARSLLPRLGQENIQRVMEVVFDAIEKEVVDLTDEEIAAITGLKEDTVRRLKNRGFQRLTRLAQEAGLNLTVYRRAVAPSEPNYDDDRIAADAESRSD